MVHVTSRKFYCVIRLLVCCVSTAICILLFRSIIHIREHVGISATQEAASARTRVSDGSVELYSELKVNLSVPKQTQRHDHNRTLYLAFVPVGRLGNQMFKFASAYGIARHLNRSLIATERSQISEYFQLDTAYANVSYWPYMEERYSCAFDNNLYDLKDHEHRSEIIVKGFLQSWKYFGDYFADIRRMFKFGTIIAQKVESFFAGYVVERRSKQSSLSVQRTSANAVTGSVTRSIGRVSTNHSVPIYVGVHIRRSDMTSGVSMDFGYDTGTEGDYIARAMIHYVTQYTNVVFVVCSDDMQWSKSSFTMPRGFTGVFNIKFCRDYDPPVVHLGILSACNYSIITGGSFGWWSAFLAGGQTVYYRGFPRPGSGLDKQFSPSKDDYYLPGWIAL